MNIYAVVITYHPSLDIFQSFEAISKQVTKLIVVDNGSNINEINILNEIHVHIENFQLILNNKNFGIAKALNIGIELALSEGATWIATLDQDSIIPINSFSSMLYNYSKHFDKDKIGIIAPLYKDINTNKIAPEVNSQHGLCEVEAVITSGNLVKSKLFREIGLFNESYFIDYVDFEFCLRCKLNGFKVVVSTDSIIEHALGNSACYNFFLWNLTSSNHSPIRLYYRTRNRFLTYKKYFFYNPRWVWSDFLSWIKEIVKINLFEKKVLKKNCFIIKGLFHGLKDITGKIDFE